VTVSSPPQQKKERCAVQSVMAAPNYEKERSFSQRCRRKKKKDDRERAGRIEVCFQGREEKNKGQDPSCRLREERKSSLLKSVSKKRRERKEDHLIEEKEVNTVG